MIKNGLLDGGSVGGDDVLVILGKISNSMGLIRQAHTTEMAVCVCVSASVFLLWEYKLEHHHHTNTGTDTYACIHEHNLLACTDK